MSSTSPTNYADITFTNVTVRRQSTSKSSDDSQNLESNSNANKEDVQNLFFCTEKGCIKSYQKLSSLHHHLDYGKHQYVLERETLYDKAMLLYATKLEEGASSIVPQISLPGNCDDEAVVSDLPMGWALKSTKPHKRLSKKSKRIPARDM